jgi:hypothetical protein
MFYQNSLKVHEDFKRQIENARVKKWIDSDGPAFRDIKWGFLAAFIRIEQ